MKQPIYYCKSWFRAKKRPTEIWPAEKAEAAHRNRQPYTALVGSAERPYCFVEVVDGVIGVGFLDTLLRESLTYAFQEVAPGQLFLSMAVHREFEGETDRVVRGVTYTFREDGAATIRRDYFGPQRVETATASFDPAAHYEAWPDFGAYDRLVRVDRP